MGRQEFSGFGSPDTEVQEVSQRAERAQESLDEALEEHPNSTLIEKLTELSEEDLALLCEACNMVNTEFASFGVYEAYEEEEDVRMLMDMLEDLVDASPQEKGSIARIIAKKIAD